MQIERINIGKYGRFANRSFDFKSGVNLISGQNESGKSTILSFIFYILYGLRENSYEVGRAEGSMLIIHGGVEYRIERVYDGVCDSCTVIETKNEKICFDGQIPGEVFLGLSEDAFKSACFADQNVGAVLDNSLIIDLAEKLVSSGSQDADADHILELIKRSEEVLVSSCKRDKNDYSDHDEYNDHSDHGDGAFDDRSLEKIRSDIEKRLDTTAKIADELLSADGKLKETEKSLAYNKKRKKLLEQQTEAYAARLKKKRFSQMAALKEKYNESDERRRLFREEHSKNGFFPDDEYLNYLYELSDSIKNYDERMEEINRLLMEQRSASFANKTNKNRENNDRRVFNGRAESIAERIRKNKFMFSFGMLLVVLTLAALGFTFFFFSVSTLFGIISAIGTVFLALGAAAAVFISMGFRIGKENYDTYNSNEYDDDETDHNDAYSNDETDFNIKRERLISERDELEELRASASMRLCEQYSRWGESIEETINDVSNLLLEYRAVDEEAKAVMAELELAEAQYKELVGADLPENVTYAKLAPDFDIQKIMREYEFLQKADVSLNNMRDELKKRLSEYEPIGEEKTAELFEKLYSVCEKNSDEKCISEAYKMAYASASRAKSELKLRLSPRVLGIAGKYIDTLTDGRFCKIDIDDNGRIILQSSNGASKSIYELGGGTSDLTYLSLRMALLSMAATDDANSKKKAFPFMLDDHLSRLDQKHFLGALSCLKKFSENEIQIFITSSAENESLMLSDINLIKI